MANLIEGGPARYHLGANPQGIEIAVHKSVVPTAEDFPAEDTVAIGAFLRLPVTFIPPTDDRGWGFGEVLETKDSPNREWVIYDARFPKGINPVDDDRGFAYSASVAR